MNVLNKKNKKHENVLHFLVYKYIDTDKCLVENYTNCSTKIFLFAIQNDVTNLKPGK